MQGIFSSGYPSCRFGWGLGKSPPFKWTAPPLTSQAPIGVCHFLGIGNPPATLGFRVFLSSSLQAKQKGYQLQLTWANFPQPPTPEPPQSRRHRNAFERIPRNKARPNLFFLGTTRPYTGAFGCVAEVGGLVSFFWKKSFGQPGWPKARPMPCLFFLGGGGGFKLFGLFFGCLRHFCV